MNKRLCKTPPMLCVVLAVVLLGTVAVAQDVYQVSDFANANVKGAPSATVRIVNPGTTAGTLCAMIYVLEPGGAMTECCGCPLSPDSLRTLDVNSDLTNNPVPIPLIPGLLFPLRATTGVIKIISSAPTGGPGECDPTAVALPTPELRAWATHIENSVSGAYPITRTAFSIADLGSEFLSLDAQCFRTQSFIKGLGVCTCGP